ncbi:ISL3 family transposase [Kineosporia babensis]|uniref:ISL3 family transposase n=1 Tax=Kineosporia babensis TaxID=499548 RepID=A0A9X1NKV7_9ACTN|nr:ISL3 family transposase [Kineosporia babensis]
MTLRAESRTCEAVCHRCGASSVRVHGRYRRTLMDAPMSGRTATIRLQVRRFRCENVSCPQATFSEQIPEVTHRHARRTVLAGAMLAQIALVLAGRAGARLASGLGLPVERDTLVRIVRRLPDPDSPERGLRILGVDDFALRRGHNYGTVLIDLDTRRPLDLPAGRDSETLTTWLHEHGNDVHVVCRDRAGAYAQATRDAIPDAVQVADRWHLWHNLAGHVEKAVKRLRSSWKHISEEHLPHEQGVDEPGAYPAEPGEPTTLNVVNAGPVTGLDARHQERWHVVHDLLDQKLSLREIMRRTGLSRGTVRVFARAARPEELYRGHRAGRGRELDQHRDFLRQQWTSGITNAAVLLGLLRARGYRGQGNALRKYLQPWRIETPSASPARKPLTVRELTRRLCTRPDDLDADEKVGLNHLLENCLPLAQHVRGFAEMMTRRTGDRNLNTWLAQVNVTTDQPELKSFARGLLTDYDAVRAGLSLPYSSGPVEGHNTRINLWNLDCQVCAALPCRTAAIGKSRAVLGVWLNWLGVGPAGVGISASLVRRRSSALCPSVTAACSSSVSEIETAILWRFPLASRSWAFVDSFGV